MTRGYLVWVAVTEKYASVKMLFTAQLKIMVSCPVYITVGLANSLFQVLTPVKCVCLTESQLFKLCQYLHTSTKFGTPAFKEIKCTQLLMIVRFKVTICAVEIAQ